MVGFENLLIMWGCLICCMSPFMSQACIDDEFNNQLQCRYDCSDEVITDKCSQLDATTHPSIDGYCCPGFFLAMANDTNPTCQRCRDNTFMPDINKCCGCIMCMECQSTANDYILVDFCASKIKNRKCAIAEDPTYPANAICPLIIPSTEHRPTTEVVNTRSPTSDGPVPVEENTSTCKRERFKAPFYAVLSILLLFVALVVACCFHVCFKCFKVNSYSTDGRAKDVTKSWGEIIEFIAAKILYTCICIADGKEDQSPNGDQIPSQDECNASTTGNGDEAKDYYSKLHVERDAMLGNEMDKQMIRQHIPMV